MKIHRLRCGVLKNNNYILEKNGTCLIVDLTDFHAVEEYVVEHNLKVEGILLTHTHWDHLTGVDTFVKKYPVPVFASSRTPNYLNENEFDYALEKYGVEVHFNVEVTSLSEGSHKIGDFTFNVIECPGHTHCTVVYYFKDVETMFTGDFLFRKTIGITTSKYSDRTLMKESLKKISQYPDEVHIYPGHGPLTVLGREKKDNPFLR